MGFFSSQKSNLPEPGESIEVCAEKKALYLQTILTLFQYMKAFSFDLKEFGAELFREKISELSEVYEKDDSIKKIRRQFEANKTMIPAFIDREKAYFLNKESELKEVIKTLSSGIASLNDKNQKFNASMHKETAKLEQISRFDDIRKIKEELAEKLSNVKSFIQQKQEQDARSLDDLSSKVATLKEELKATRITAMTDGLTCAYNRLALDTKLGRMISGDKRGFSILMLDIDNFKMINDSYGHQVGDRVLMALARKCKRLIRESDFIARYGGEEFMIILPGASLKNAVKKGQMLRQKIAHTEYAADSASGSHPLSFTVSIGVSERRRGDSVNALVGRADKALYKAKQTGKNRVISEKEID
ncbi:MAG: diguanylate cyclase [Nitrospiria bacterium]